MIARAAALAAGALVLTPSPPAPAYVPYTTPGGVPLHWPGVSVRYAVAADVPPPLTAPGVQRICADSFAAWATLPCAPFEAAFDGFVAGLAPDGGDRVNALVWVHDVATWRASYGATELARTALTHRVTSGEILDADVVFNTGGFAFAEALGCAAEAYDLQATLTHELGHLFGLDHTPLADATMAATTDPGVCTKRTLSPDDTAGFCATYEPLRPPDPAPEAEPDAGGGDSAVADAPEGEAGARDDGCAAGAGAASGLLAALGALLSAAGRSSRRRRRARSPARAR